MRIPKLSVSPGFLLFAGLVYFFDSTGLVSAAIPAVVLHELGHMAALRLCGGRTEGIRLTLPGFSLDYSGFLSRGGECFAALAGPVIGLVYFAAAAWTGKALASRFLALSAALSLLLSLFNLLPILPLDGGRALRCLTGEKPAEIVSAGCACSLCAFALWGCAHGWGFSLLITGLWLLAGVVIPSGASAAAAHNTPS